MYNIRQEDQDRYVVYKGNNEVSRIIGQTNKEAIYSAIKKGI